MAGPAPERASLSRKSLRRDGLGIEILSEPVEEEAGKAPGSNLTLPRALLKPVQAAKVTLELMAPRRSLRLRWSGAVLRLRRQARADYCNDPARTPDVDVHDLDGHDSDFEGDCDSLDKGAKSSRRRDHLELLAQCARDLGSRNESAQLEAARALSQQLNVEDGAPHVVPRGVILRLVAMLADASRPQIQAEAAKCVSALAWNSAVHARVALDAGAGTVLANALLSPDANVRERAVCSIGNIAGSSVESRDRILAVAHLERDLLASLQLPSPESEQAGAKASATAAAAAVRRAAKKAAAFTTKAGPRLSAAGMGGRRRDNVEIKDEEDEEEAEDKEEERLDQENDQVLEDQADEAHRERIRAALPYLRNGTWTLKWLCAGRPQPDPCFTRKFARTLGKLVQLDDDELLVDASCALSFLSEGPNCNIQAVQGSGSAVVERLVALLSHRLLEVRTSALRALGNCVTGEDAQTQKVVDAGAVAVIGGLLGAEEASTRKEVLWTLSNVTAGTASQIQAVLNAENVMAQVMQELAAEELALAVEAVWVVSNLLSGGDHDQIVFVVERYEAVQELARFLQRDGCQRAVQAALEGLQNICRVGSLERENKFLARFKRAGLVSLFEDMTSVKAKGRAGAGAAADVHLAHSMLELLYPRVDNFGFTFKRMSSALGS